MHGKKNYINKSKYSIQGLRTVSNSLPHGLKTILKKGGHNYSSIIYNWSDLVGKKISNICYPKSVRTDRELKNGTLVLNVFHGDQITVEYSKKDIIDKINSFFGYNCIAQISLKIVQKEIDPLKKKVFNLKNFSQISQKIEELDNKELKSSLNSLLKAFNEKNK